MCGRFVLLTDLGEIEERFAVAEKGGVYVRGGNLTPGRPVSAVVREGVNRLVALHWGLVPSWAKDPAVGRRMFNARAETIAEKPSFREAFRRRRCLIPADGYYEWQKTPGRRKQPWLIRLRSRAPFAFAGIHEIWKGADGEVLRSCAIVTTTPNDLLAPIHDRMPVIVRREDEERWLDGGERDQARLLAVLRPYPPEEMEALPVPPPFPGGA
ncbi:MAG TPA: SOS response-associated peptidase [Syntrophales bacterium]|nr:SOS response-associated peptidase [Syntrophales bacterium]HRV43632.1 SOS response-associated peptidase [Syntrophales bacterium]